ncbi:DUF697 domain-containing protein [Telmatospirillum sp.]|uniref:DUF697 domain-containing protein n=1 Tax=Telmatospirillum sp. TaxID=2079197 RepID=UPI0028461C1A|nr:DUF697 domain-containing protein [Telmatospirillum sp.]MDR3436283.1 DUF697 domain-containing protein [Telmatospirillum sp.]
MSEVEAKTIDTTTGAPPDLTAALHRAQAREVVERYSTYAAVGCVVPLPLIEMATLAAVVFKMCRTLAIHYQVPLSQTRARSVVIALICALIPTGLGNLTTAALLKIVPGADVLGFAAASMSAAALTRLAGFSLIAQFESGDASLPTDLAVWRQRIKAVA